MDNLTKFIDKITDGIIVAVVLLIIFGFTVHFGDKKVKLYCSKNGIEYLLYNNGIAPNLSEFGLPKKCEAKKDG